MFSVKVFESSTSAWAPRRWDEEINFLFYLFNLKYSCCRQSVTTENWQLDVVQGHWKQASPPLNTVCRTSALISDPLRAKQISTDSKQQFAIPLLIFLNLIAMAAPHRRILRLFLREQQQPLHRRWPPHIAPTSLGSVSLFLQRSLPRIEKIAPQSRRLQLTTSLLASPSFVNRRKGYYDMGIWVQRMHAACQFFAEALSPLSSFELLSPTM